MNQQETSNTETAIEALNAISAFIKAHPDNITRWREMGFNPATLTQQPPTDKLSFLAYLREKKAVRLASEKVWNLQNKVLSLTLGVAVVGGIVSAGLGAVGWKSTNPVQNTQRYLTAITTSNEAFGFDYNNIWRLDLFLKLAFGLGGAIAFSRYGVSYLMRSLDISDDWQEACRTINIAFLRQLPNLKNIPSDLADNYRHTWFGEDGLPVSVHVTKGDLTHKEHERVGQRWSVNTLAVGLALTSFPSIVLGAAVIAICARPDLLQRLSVKNFLSNPPKAKGLFLKMSLAAAAGFGLPWNMLAVGYIGLVKAGRWLLQHAAFNMSPLRLRAVELDGSGALESMVYTHVGGQKYTQGKNEARQQQIEDASRDNSPLFYLGESSGLMAERGNMFAPSEGLPFILSLNDLRRHLLIFGGTGSGKTHGLLRPMINQALEQPDLGVLILDGKGSLPAEYEGIKDVILVTPKNSVISLVSGLTPALLVDTLADIYQPDAASDASATYWINQGTMLMTKAATLCHFVGGDYWTLTAVVKATTIKDYRDEVIELIKEKVDGDVDNIPTYVMEAINYFITEWDTKKDEKYVSNTIESARAFVNEFQKYPELKPWMDAAAGGDSIDITSVLTGSRIAVNIPEYEYFRAGAGIVALLKSRVYAGIRARAAKDESEWLADGQKPVLMVIDEAQDVVTKEDTAMLPIVRSLGLAVVAATQTIEGIEARLKKEMANKWVGVFSSFALLKNSSHATYEWVSRKLGGCAGSIPRDVVGMGTHQMIKMEMVQTNLMEELGINILGDGKNRSFLTSAAQAKFEGQNERAFKRYNADGVTSNIGTFEMINPSDMQDVIRKKMTAFVVADRANALRVDLINLCPSEAK